MILHVDGDAFFVGCEISRRPDLRGRPVVTGAERGIASAVSYEAKARGVVRGMPIFQIRKICPEVTVLQSDYELYSMIAERMYAIVRRFSPVVEEYSIDECFAEIPNASFVDPDELQTLAEKVRKVLSEELGVSFSVGIAKTKVLAKIASKHKKPAGAVYMRDDDRAGYMKDLPVVKLWGIGEATTERLALFGVKTAEELSGKPRAWVEAHFNKPVVDIWWELHGVSVLSVSSRHVDPQSVQKTKTFTPPSRDKNFLRKELSYNTENACIRLRRYGMLAGRIAFFLKTQDFKYLGFEFSVSSPTDSAQEILGVLIPHFERLFDDRLEYRATGITLLALAPKGVVSGNLFDLPVLEKEDRAQKAMDKVGRRFGKHTVFLASSLESKGMKVGLSLRKTPDISSCSFFGETARRRLYLPHLGFVE